jgi:hypothetical protein
MSRLGFALAMLAVVAAAAWAYNVNYQTKMALARVDLLHRQIAAEREAVEVLRVEWAYLNAPARLARLVAMNDDRLELMPMTPQHFEDVAAIPFPSNPAPEVPAEPASAVPVPAEAMPEPPLVISERKAATGGGMPLPAPKPASWSAR